MLDIGFIKNVEMEFRYQLIINSLKSRCIRPPPSPFPAVSLYKLQNINACEFFQIMILWFTGLWIRGLKCYQ